MPIHEGVVFRILSEAEPLFASEIAKRLIIPLVVHQISFSFSASISFLMSSIAKRDSFSVPSRLFASAISASSSSLVREFPREIEPRFLLRNVMYDQGRVADTKSIIEGILRIDDRQAYAYNDLAAADVAQGDLASALVALDKYAGLVPANDPNPIASRGDAFAETGHYREAVPEYRKNLELNPTFMGGSYKESKLALAYLYLGNASQAEDTVQATYATTRGEERAIAAGVLGDIEVEQGRLNLASDYHEKATREFANSRSPRKPHCSSLRRFASNKVAPMRFWFWAVVIPVPLRRVFARWPILCSTTRLQQRKNLLSCATP